MKWPINIQPSNPKLIDDFLRDLFDSTLLLGIVLSYITPIILSFYNINIPILNLAIILFCLAYLTALIANKLHWDKTKYIFGYCTPLPFYLYIAIAFPFLKMEALFCFLTAIGALILVKEKKLRLLIFLVYCVCTILFQAYEVYTNSSTPLNPTQITMNDILIFLFISFLISMFVLLHKLNNFHLDAERQAKEKQLGEAFLFLETLVNTIDFPIYYKDLDGKLQGCNNAFNEFYGINRNNIVGKSTENYITEPYLNDLAKADEKVLETGNKYLYETKSINQNGEKKEILVYNSLFRNRNNVPTGILGIEIDITEQNLNKQIIKKQLKKLDAMNAALKESNEKLENYALIASHDLNAPVRTINSFAKLLNKKAETKLNESEKEFLDLIISSSENLKNMIVNLLKFSRISEKNLDKSEFDVQKTIELLLIELNSVINEKQPKIIINDLPRFITADKVLIRLLFQNLISNAIKYNKNQPVIKISGKENHHFWVFEIDDNGIGIASDKKEKIFSLFSKLHPTQEYEGSGIGLATCKRIVDIHQGFFEVESEVEQGSTFRFYLKKS